MSRVKHGTDFSGLKDVIRETDPRLDQDAVIFIAAAMEANMSFDKAQEKYDLCGEVTPLCRNRFYKVRRRVLDKLNQN